VTEERNVNDSLTSLFQVFFIPDDMHILSIQRKTESLVNRTIHLFLIYYCVMICPIQKAGKDTKRPAAYDVSALEQN
jgi:hypothetical protein